MGNAQRLCTIDPTSGEVTREWPTMPTNQALQIVEDVSKAWTQWQTWSLEKRSDCFRRLAHTLRDRADDFASLITSEMGKPIAQSKAEVLKCAVVCDYFANEAPGMLADQMVESSSRDSMISFQPIGIIYAVMPWNLPFWQVLRAASPTMMAGNAMVLKHAPNVLGCAMAIEDLFRSSGFPEHVFRSLLINLETSPRIIEHPAVRGVTLTGSERAGRAVAAQAGAALKKSVLELGGSDPYVVLEDADVDAAARTCVQARMLNNGQVCISAKRFIAVEDILEDFTARVLDLMQGYAMESPLQEDCQLGPLARQDLRDLHHDQVQRSVEAGAVLATGGVVPDRAGWWYPPTVLTSVRPGTPGFTEEFFGPTACIISAKDEAEAIALANNTTFGLGGAVFTQDEDRGRRIARDHIQVGCCAVNGFVQSDPRLPFGGVNDSGYGREMGAFGIHEFVNIKTIMIP